VERVQGLSLSSTSTTPLRLHSHLVQNHLDHGWFGLCVEGKQLSRDAATMATQILVDIQILVPPVEGKGHRARREQGKRKQPS
jgi:hypothetical protein